MASSYVNDLRLNEMATGDASGTWGDTTNTNLELIAEAFSYGTEAITTNADTHTTTIADGATDPGRSMYLKYTGTLDSACTITIGPNTVSKVWIIENGTSGSQDIILSQGSGANITIPAGDTKVVYSDGAGAGAAFVDAFASINVGALTAGTLTVGSGSVTDSSGAISFGNENLTTTGIVTAAGTSVFTNLDISGDVDVDGTLETDNLTVGGAQGTDGQVLTSTGSGVGWEAVSSAPYKTFGTSSIMIGDTTTGTIDAANYNTGVGVDVFEDLTSGDNNAAFGFFALGNNTSGGNNTMVGAYAGALNIDDSDNTAVGYAANYPDGGSNNTAIGSVALNANTGSDNTAVGKSALYANTTGGSNTAIGTNALGSNTTASNNTAMAQNALAACTTGTQNVAIGHNALSTSVAGNYQTAVGYQALKTSNYTANVVAYNTAFGWNAGLANTTGKVTAVGAAALTSNTTGINNAAFGGATDAQGAALEANTTGSNNTAFGYAALRNNTTAGDNTAFGASALSVNTTGAFNTALGRQALELNTTAAYNTAVGYYALRATTEGANNTAVGYLAGGANTTGAQSIYVGYSAGNYTVLNTTGNYNTMIGPFCHGTAADTTNANVIGYNVAGEGGYTTIGISGDDIRAAHGTATWATVSDERVKKDIADSTAGLSFINDLRPRTFNFKAKGDLPKEFTGYEEGSTESYKNSKTQHGFIAQEVKAVIDNHSELTEGFNLWNVRDTGQQEVAEAALIPMLVKAIQELSAEVEKLKGE
jgi:trimeric autotransporter adhesin